MTIGTGTALQYLTNRFAGQLVLYSAELAEVLGKSERALGHLIARGSLPFKTKKLGGRICVDVFQVAEWLSSHEELEPTYASIKSSRTTTMLEHSGSGRRSVADKLLKMRLEAASTLRRFSDSNLDELAFIYELAGCLEQSAATGLVESHHWSVKVHFSGRFSQCSEPFSDFGEALQSAELFKDTDDASSIAIYWGQQCKWIACQLTPGDWVQLLDKVTDQ